MRSKDFIFWEVDVQRDFMLPGGNLYVPGAEKLIPNIRRLTDAAKQDKVFLVSHGTVLGGSQLHEASETRIRMDGFR